MTRRAVGAGLLGEKELKELPFSEGVVIFYQERYVIYNPGVFRMLEGPADPK